MKRLLVYFLLLIVLTGAGWFVYTAALSPEETAWREAHPPEIDWDSIVDDPNEKLTITWYPLPRFPSGREGTWGERVVEEMFNIDIKPILTDAMAYDRRKSLMFAGGDIPDITWDGDPINVQTDAHHGCIVPVPRAVVEKYAPTYSRLISENAPIAWLYAHHQGRNWGIPTPYLWGAYATPGVWRMDWLRAVGIDEPPQTLDAFGEALRRITFDDPDGNGKDDTFGMSGNMSAWFQAFPEFFGAYGVTPFDWMERDDGRAIYGGILPGTKQALAILRDWYAEGLIDPEFITDGNDHKRLKDKLMNGRIGYVSGLGSYPELRDKRRSVALFNVIKQFNPEAEVVVAPLPKGPTGKRGVRTWGSGGNIMVFGPGVVEKPQKVIRILKIYEYYVSNGFEVYVYMTRGEEGKHWEFAPEDEGGGVIALPPYDDSNHWQREVLTIYTSGGVYPEYEDRLTPAGRVEFRDTHRKKEWALVDALGKPDIVPSAQRYLVTLRNRQMTLYTEIIRGERPLDDFDIFVEEWNRKGGRQMTEEATALLEEKRRIFAEIGMDARAGEGSNE